MLFLLGLSLLGVGLLLFRPHLKAPAHPLAPWAPPELAMAGVPVDPTQALQALAVHGTVPECREAEEVAADEDEDEDEEDDHYFAHRAQHSRVYVPVTPLAGLEGHTETILPYLGHPSELVVHRAATLLCFIQDGPSKRGLTWLGTHYPCRPWVRRTLAGAGVTQEKANCPLEQPIGGYALLSTPLPEGSEPSPEALALARRISQGEASAVHQALQATQAMELSRRPEGVQALMNVSTTQGLALVFQALLEDWEAEVLFRSVDRPDSKMSWSPQQLLAGVGGAAFRSVVARTGRSPEQVVVDVAGLLPESLEWRLAAWVWPDKALLYAVGRFARSPAGREVTSATARKLLDRIDQETVNEDPREIKAEAQRITALFEAGNRVALEQLVSSQPRTSFQHMLAACYLMGLGQGEIDLTMYKPPYQGFFHQHRVVLQAMQQVLHRLKPRAARDRLQRIFDQVNAQYTTELVMLPARAAQQGIRSQGGAPDAR